MNKPKGIPARWSRRRALRALALAGAGGLAFRRALAVLAEGAPEVTEEMIRQAEWISGVEMTPDQRALAKKGISELLEAYETNRAVALDNGVAPALRFEPRSHPVDTDLRGRIEVAFPTVPAPRDEDDLAFASITTLAALLRSRAISSEELTRLFLDRVERFDPVLRCVIERTDALALDLARRVDGESAAGRWRGPLHGVPWGAKDLLAVPGYRTTWGAAPYRDRVIDVRSTAFARLEQAGAPLLGKLTLGALAWGDVWYDATTKNPWNTEQGSSGSSAGPAAAVAAGLAPFTIGSETWGSIVSPCTRCGATGLRPTFGRISRHGAMALSWSMDKLGPIARSAEDCAVVFAALHGADGLDPTARTLPFDWPLRRDVRTVRLGFVPEWFDEDRGADAESDDDKAMLREWADFDRRALRELASLGLEPEALQWSSAFPVESLSFILSAEAAAAFDDLTRSGKDDQLVRQVEQAWPNVFRQAQTIPAVEYIRANRIRTRVMEELEREVFRHVDVLVSPSYGGDQLLRTNLTGHPCVVVPNGFRREDGTPTSISFVGRLDGETEMLAVAHAFQQATDYHLRRPVEFLARTGGDRP